MNTEPDGASYQASLNQPPCYRPSRAPDALKCNNFADCLLFLVRCKKKKCETGSFSSAVSRSLASQPTDRLQFPCPIRASLELWWVLVLIPHIVPVPDGRGRGRPFSTMHPPNQRATIRQNPMSDRRMFFQRRANLKSMLSNLRTRGAYGLCLAARRVTPTPPIL